MENLYLKDRSNKVTYEAILAVGANGPRAVGQVPN